MKESTLIKIRNIIFAAAIVLSMLCPIAYAGAQLNQGEIKSVRYVSVIEALFFGRKQKGDFIYTVSVSPALAAAIILQIAGLILAFYKKGYGAGIVLVIASWAILYLAHCVTVNMQSELFDLNGGIVSAGNSGFSLITVAFDIAYFACCGIVLFGNKRKE